MNQNLLQILEELEDQTEVFITEFESKMNPASKDIFAEIQDFVGTLNKNKAGNLAASVENLSKIDRFKTNLNKLLDQDEYGTAVKDYINSFKQNTAIVDSFYSTMVAAYQANAEMKGLLFKETASTTLDTLLKSGIDANFTDPVVKLLKDNVVNGSSRKNAVKAIEEYIIGTGETKLLRYSKQVASDAITQFNANYIQLVSNDLGLNHYFYKGTKIKTTRDFCESLVGKYFTEYELKKIVENKSPWSGMIKGTTWATFPRYRGGYNCRHYLIPVSKELYDNYQKK